MIVVSDKTSCSGCTACASVCNQNAIKMCPDALGFLYPSVDMAKCINCGLCDNVCAFKTPHELNNEQQAYLMQHIDSNEVLKSKSGGAFVALSNVILRYGGLVYGVKLNKTTHLAEHSEASTFAERDFFRGSKYIESNLNDIFRNIKENLKKDKIVLFSGTPCQVAGLKSYVGKKLGKKLILVDILCHGVASPKIWTDYISELERKLRKKIIKCIPRNPIYGWDNSVDTFILEDGSEYSSDYFTGYVYHKWITQRWSCSVCPFTNLNRVSDITIGDAWGAKKLKPEFDPENIGGSIILVNSNKGRILFEAAKNEMMTIHVDINKMMQPVLKSPTLFHNRREDLENAYAKHGFKYVRFFYLNNTFVVIKSLIQRMLSKVKHLIKIS